MDGVVTGDAHSVSAVAVIDLGGGGDRGHGGHRHGGDPHGLLSGHTVVVIGGEEHAALLGAAGHTPDDDDDDEDDEESDDDEEGDDECGCGEDCGHVETPVHMIQAHGIAHAGTTAARTFGGGGDGGGDGGGVGGGAAGSGGDHSPTLSSNASTNGGNSSSHANKRKRVVLSIHEKQQVLQRLEMGEQPVVISRDFGISRQQVSDIKKNRDRILAFCIDAKHLSSLRRKTLKATTEYHPGVEQELYRWLIRQRKLGRGVSADALAHKTTDLFMQYAADDAANVSFRSINVWLRHFKRAHNIKTMDDDELARLPTKFTPAMDMAGTSHGAGVATSGDGGATSVNEGSVGCGSPSPSMMHDVPQASPPPGAGAASPADDVSSYMTNMVELSSHTTHTPPPPPSASSSSSHPSFLLQNHAPTIDVNAPHPYQMLMISSASSLAATTMTAATASMTMTMPMAATAATAPGSESVAAAVALGASPLQSCVQLAQKLASELSRFEHDMARKLDTLDARVNKLCFSVLSTTTTGSTHNHSLHTTSSRFA